MKKRVLTLVLTAAMAVTALTGCGSFKGDEVVATVESTDITADLANFFARYTQAEYETYYAAYLGEDMWTSDASDGNTYEESVKESVLKTLENMILLEQHMSDYGVELTDEEKALITETAAKFDEANTFEEKEMISGDKDTVERALTLMAVQQKMMDAIQADVDTEVSDEEAAQKSMDYVLFSYKETDETGKSTDITDDQKKEYQAKAAAIAEGLKAGEDFAVLAENAGVEVKTTTFDAEAKMPDEALVKAADALEEGGSTEVVEGEYGCYVAKVTSLLDRATTDTKKAEIVQERKTKLYNDTVDGWREKAEIKVNKSVWKKVSFQKLSVTMKTQEKVPYADPPQTDDKVQE